MRNLITKILEGSQETQDVIEDISAFADEVHTVKESITTSQCVFPFWGKAKIYLYRLLELRAPKVVLFVFCCAIVVPLATAFFKAGKIPSALGALMTGYITQREAPKWLEEMGVIQ